MNEKKELFAYIESMFKTLSADENRWGFVDSHDRWKRFRDYAVKSIEFYTETRSHSPEEREEMLNYLCEVENKFDSMV